MAIENGQSYEITSGGGTITIDVTQPIPDFIGLYSTTTFSLLGNWSLEFSATPPVGTKITVGIQLQSVTLNSHTIEIFGSALSQIELRVGGGCYELHYFGGLLIWANAPVPSQNNSISGYAIDAMPTDRISGMTSAQIIVADGANVAQAVTVSGDVTINSSGVTAIGANKVTNTMLAGSIARTKLAAGTADRVLTNNGAGAYTEVAQLQPSLGGTGQSFASSTGFQKWSGGTASVGALTDSKIVAISLETAFLGDYKVLFPFDCTITGVYGSVSKAIAGTDDATITVKNNSGTTMTGGVLTFTASSAKGTAQTGAISANNVISAGQVVTITGAKTTAGGEVLTILTYTRTS